MELRKIKTDCTQKELYEHEDNSFPVTLDIDHYNELYDNTLNCHYHYDVEYTLVLSGELDYYINGSLCRIKAGDAVFVNSNTLHMAKSMQQHNPASTFVVLFPTSLLAKDAVGSVYQKYFQPILGKSLQGSIITSASPAGSKILSLLHQIKNLNPQEFGYELFCLSILYQLWKYTVDYLKEKSPAIFAEKQEYKNAETAKAMLMYIHENYAEHLTIPLISKAINVSKSECFRCFKLFTQKTPIEYINEYRLEQAQKMLIDTTCNITEISCACGFCSSSYFTKLFKEKYQMSPRQYRESFF